MRAAWFLGAVTWSLAGIAAAAPAPGAYLSFLACPLARDTGPDTDLCFLAEHEGHLFALVNPPDFGQPQLKHRVLVEGRVGSGPPVCGAAPIEGRVSVLAELDPSCDQVLPFDGSVVGVAGGIFNSGTPEQRARAQELARRAESDPSLSVLPAVPEPAPAPAPAPPFSRRELTVLFPFDSDRGSGPDMLELMKLVAYAKAAQARLEIVAYRGASRLSDGRLLTERERLATQRAEKLADIVRGLGLPASAVRVRAEETPAAAVGEDDWRRRRAELTVLP